MLTLMSTLICLKCIKNSDKMYILILFSAKHSTFRLIVSFVDEHSRFIGNAAVFLSVSCLQIFK